MRTGASRCQNEGTSGTSGIRASKLRGKIVWLGNFQSYQYIKSDQISTGNTIYYPKQPNLQRKAQQILPTHANEHLGTELLIYMYVCHYHNMLNVLIHQPHGKLAFTIPSARMCQRPESYCSCPVCVCVCVRTSEPANLRTGAARRLIEGIVSLSSIYATITKSRFF